MMRKSMVLKSKLIKGDKTGMTVYCVEAHSTPALTHFTQIPHATKLLMLTLMFTFRAVDGNPLHKHKSVSRDFCQEEPAILSCESNHVLTVQSALYGRMHSQSHCIRDSDNANGCHADATSRIDQCCSGRQNCSFNVKDLIGKYETGCGDLKDYLRVTYICIPAISPSKCRENIELGEDSGFFSYPSPTALPLGTDNCPWRLEAKRNQKITVYIKSMKQQTCKIDEPDVTTCSRKLIAFSEREAASTMASSVNSRGTSLRVQSQRVDICQKRNQQAGLLYTSTSHLLDVHFPSRGLDTQHTMFFQYKVIGCPAIETPGGGWVQQNETTARVQCLDSKETWYLSCKGNKWNGVFGNCSAGSNLSGFSDTKSEGFPYSIIMAVFLGILIGVIIGVLMLGFVYLWYRKKPRNDYQDPDAGPAHYYGGGNTARKGSYTYSTNTHQRSGSQGAILDGTGGGVVRTTGYDVGGVGMTSDYTAYHSNTCPSHSHSSIYGKYMGIIPQDDSGHTLITHCPHSSEGITRTTGSSVQHGCDTGSTPVGGGGGGGGGGRHITCYYDCGNTNDKL